MSLGQGIEKFDNVVVKENTELVFGNESLVGLLVLVFGTIYLMLGTLIMIIIFSLPYILVGGAVILIIRIITNKSTSEYKQIKAIIDKLQVKLDKVFTNTSYLADKCASAISGELNKNSIKGKATISKNFTKEEFYKKIGALVKDAAKNNKPIPPVQYSEVIVVKYSGDHATAYDIINDTIKSFSNSDVQFSITEQSKGGMISSAAIVVGAIINPGVSAEELASVCNAIKSVIEGIVEKNNLKKSDK